MNLKKAFQYQRALLSLQNELMETMLQGENYVKVTETRQKSQLNQLNSNYNFQDEVKDVSALSYGKYDFKKVMLTYNKLVEWRSNLAKAIAEAKTTVAIGDKKLSYDAALVYAKDMRRAKEYYATLELLDNTCNQDRDADEYYGSRSRYLPVGPKEKNAVFRVPTEAGTAELDYTVLIEAVPDKEVVTLASQARIALLEELDQLSDLIESASLTTNIAKELEPPVPLQITLETLYKNIETYA